MVESEVPSSGPHEWKIPVKTDKNGLFLWIIVQGCQAVGKLPNSEKFGLQRYQIVENQYDYFKILYLIKKRILDIVVDIHQGV